MSSSRDNELYTMEIEAFELETLIKKLARYLDRRLILNAQNPNGRAIPVCYLAPAYFDFNWDGETLYTVLKALYKEKPFEQHHPLFWISIPIYIDRLEKEAGIQLHGSTALMLITSAYELAMQHWDTFLHSKGYVAEKWKDEVLAIGRQKFDFIDLLNIPGDLEKMTTSFYKRLDEAKAELRVGVSDHLDIAPEELKYYMRNIFHLELFPQSPHKKAAEWALAQPSKNPQASRSTIVVSPGLESGISASEPASRQERNRVFKTTEERRRELLIDIQAAMKVASETLEAYAPSTSLTRLYAGTLRIGANDIEAGLIVDEIGSDSLIDLAANLVDAKAFATNFFKIYEPLEHLFQWAETTQAVIKKCDAAGSKEARQVLKRLDDLLKEFKEVLKAIKYFLEEKLLNQLVLLPADLLSQCDKAEQSVDKLLETLSDEGILKNQKASLKALVSNSLATLSKLKEDFFKELVLDEKTPEPSKALHEKKSSIVRRKSE